MSLTNVKTATAEISPINDTGLPAEFAKILYVDDLWSDYFAMLSEQAVSIDVEE